MRTTKSIVDSQTRKTLLIYCVVIGNFLLGSRMIMSDANQLILTLVPIKANWNNLDFNIYMIIMMIFNVTLPRLFAFRLPGPSRTKLLFKSFWIYDSPEVLMDSMMRHLDYQTIALTNRPKTTDISWMYNSIDESICHIIGQIYVCIMIGLEPIK